MSTLQCGLKFGVQCCIPENFETKKQLIIQEIIEIMINGQYSLAGFAFVTKAEIVKVLLKSQM